MSMNSLDNIDSIKFGQSAFSVLCRFEYVVHVCEVCIFEGTLIICEKVARSLEIICYPVVSRVSGSLVKLVQPT